MDHLWISDGQRFPEVDIADAACALNNELDDQNDSVQRRSPYDGSDQKSIQQTHSPVPFTVSPSDPRITSKKNISPRLFSLDAGSDESESTSGPQLPSNSHRKSYIDALPTEILLLIMGHLSTWNIVSLSLTNVKHHNAVPPDTFQAIGKIYHEDVQIHGMQLSALSRAWSTSRKGITWDIDFLDETVYCWAECHVEGYMVYTHTVPEWNSEGLYKSNGDTRDPEIEDLLCKARMIFCGQRSRDLRFYC